MTRLWTIDMATITDNDLALFRERAKTEFRSTGDVGRLAWGDVVEALCKEVSRLRSVSSEGGDVAKLREAVEACLYAFQKTDWTTIGTSRRVVDLIQRCKDALSAPPRNCDRFQTKFDAKRAWEKVCKAGLPEHGPFEAWIFALATEKEGGNDGNE